MTLTEAKKIIGNKAIWEIKNMERALSFFEILNTEEENKRLLASRIILKNKNKKIK